MTTTEKRILANIKNRCFKAYGKYMISAAELQLAIVEGMNLKNSFDTKVGMIKNNLLDKGFIRHSRGGNRLIFILEKRFWNAWNEVTKNF